MKHLTMEQRKARRDHYLAWALVVSMILFVGICMGCAAMALWYVPEKEVVTEYIYVMAEPQEAEEAPTEEVVAVNYSSLDPLENIGTFTATAYCPCVECCGIWSARHPDRGDDYVQRTASGTIPTEGRTIAADWDVLPAGSEVVIYGHTYIVEDTGAAIEGNRIDVFFADHQAALEWGVQEVEVYVDRSAS